MRTITKLYNAVLNTSRKLQSAWQEATETFRSNDDVQTVIAPLLKHFSGAMNALNDMIENPDCIEGNSLFTNVEQIIEAHGSERLKKWFSKYFGEFSSWDETQYQKNSLKLMSIFKSCGIESNKENRIIWSEEKNKYYKKIGTVAPGSECQVLAPYWTYKGEIFEQGIIKTI